MNQQLPKLIELQALDRRILEIKDQQRQLPTLIDTAEAPLREATRSLQEATAQAETLNKGRRDLERDLDAHEAQVEKMKSRSTELKTNKEYQAYLFEIELANKRKGEIEEQILLLMEQIEQAQRVVKEFQAKVADATKTSGQEKARLETLAANLMAELAELDLKQKNLATSVDKGLLSRYNRLKAGRKDLALAAVKNGICQGCRLQIPPQLVAEVRRSEVLQTCSYCQRILYLENGEGASSVPAEPVENADRDR